MTTITLPKSHELDLTIESELHKLPTEAAHNHFHNLAEKADKIQDQARTMSLVSLILCGLELEHLKEVNKSKGNTEGASVLPWKQWVAENCEFTYMTATRYAKAVKCARAGMLDDLDPDLIPTLAPSLMNKEDLQDACQNLADALQGYGSRRQLYLQLEILKTPQKQTIEQNRNTGGAPKKTPEILCPDIERADAKAAIIPTLKPLDDYLSLNKHTLLEPADLKELDDALQSARDILKPFLKSATNN